MANLYTKIGGDADTGTFCYTGSVWQHAVIAKAEFPDGVIRTVRLNQQADTMFSWPGRASRNGSTARCYVTCDNGRYKGFYSPNN